ncbi:MAG: hypothetical protein HUU35_19075, partial [Armatimonadetes bacterium]|nr:hypothetical protein [Armatimonadota bacterium]
MTSAIIQYFLNDHLEPDEIRWQMQQFAAAGYQGVYPHARAGLSTPYGSAAWWAALDTILECCQQHGLEFWIWDEDYYPSGWAGGRVVWENPGLAARRLAFSVSEQQGALIEADFGPGLLLRAFALSGEEMIDVTEHCGTRRQTWGPRLVLHRAYSPLIHDVGHPHWRAWMSDNRFALEWRPPHAGPWTIVGVTDQVASDDYPDILRPEGIARFLELTHAAYHQRYGREFGRTIKGCFTDEPSPAGSNFPWTPRFATEFERDHGYNLLDHLPHLALDIDSRTPAIRHHYRATQGRLLTEHYTQQIGAWCDEHQIVLAGHLTRTEWLSLTAAWWPNEIRCYQPMHIPSADPLGGSVGFPDAGSYATGLKVASSAAHLFGRAQAGGDVLAVVGEEMGLRDLRYLLDLHLVMGINHFTLHGASYSFAGPRKDEVPPSLFVQHSQWRHFDVLMQHLTEQAAALTGGEHVCHLALLYPSTSLACQVTPGGQPDLADERPIHQLVELLLRQQSDFDFLDELTLQEKVDQAGRLTTPEPYQVILLPYLRYLEAGSAAALERF